MPDKIPKIKGKTVSKTVEKKVYLSDPKKKIKTVNKIVKARGTGELLDVRKTSFSRGDTKSIQRVRPVNEGQKLVPAHVTVKKRK